jgi:hypothetical protein
MLLFHHQTDKRRPTTSHLNGFELEAIIIMYVADVYAIKITNKLREGKHEIAIICLLLRQNTVLYLLRNVTPKLTITFTRKTSVLCIAPGIAHSHQPVVVPTHRNRRTMQHRIGVTRPEALKEHLLSRSHASRLVEVTGIHQFFPHQIFILFCVAIANFEVGAGSNGERVQHFVRIAR